MVSSLSLFLYWEKTVLFGKDHNNKIVVVQSMPREDWETQFVSNEIYQLDIPTRIFVHSKQFSLVPGSLYNPLYAATYLTFAGDVSSDFHYFSSKLESNNIHLVSAISQTDYAKLAKNKSSIQFHHGAASFLAYTLNEKNNYLSQELIAYFIDDRFYLVAFHKEELVAFNLFEWKDKDQILSYIFGIIHQLNFDRKHCRLSIYGELESNQLDEAWGKEYFKNFRLKTPEQTQNYHIGPDQFAKSDLFVARWEYN